MPTKALLRRTILSKLQSQKAGNRKKKSRLIETKLLNLKELQDSKLACFYVSMPIEVDTRALIGRLLSLGKRVAVPTADLKKRALNFFEIRNFKKDLKIGTLGILEPNPMRTKKIEISEIDFVAVPGIAFDRQNNRLGRGAGFYDRFLGKLNKRVTKVGLAFEMQLVPKVPVEKHDVKLDCVITEKT